MKADIRKSSLPSLHLLPLLSISVRSKVDYVNLKQSKLEDIRKLAEVSSCSKFLNSLTSSCAPSSSSSPFSSSCIPSEDLRLVVEAGLTTFLLHVEARIASALGVGFYTIGPCGEELLAAVALHFRATDAVALHYRHVATAVSRQLKEGKPLHDIILDRSRGFACSTLDPVTGGRHCAIGGTKYDFLVTSTLASQATPALGRALAIPMSSRIPNPKFPVDAVSYVSIGDGSVNNSHFLSAVQLARYAQHRGFKCPVIFAISDNDKCISLSGYGWLHQWVQDAGIETFAADGVDIESVYRQSGEAIAYSRTKSRPSLLVFKNLPRRFGHSAADRQFAYRTNEEIASEMNRDPLFEV